jgi:hypothetical protein
MHRNITECTHEKQNWVYGINFEITPATDIFNMPVSDQFLLKGKTAEM